MSPFHAAPLGAGILALVVAACAGQEPIGPTEGRDWDAVEPLRAQGNEPGWHADLGASHVTLVTDYGLRRLEVPAPSVVTRTGVRQYGSAGDDLTVTVVDERCADDMTGMPYPFTVTVSLGTERLRGCGGDPRSSLDGADWTVVEIDGEAPVGPNDVTMRFEDERIVGHAPCNHYGARFTLHGEGIGIDGAVSTRMACAPPLMSQEDAFFTVLEDARWFRFEEDGALVLEAADSRRIVARR